MNYIYNTCDCILNYNYQYGWINSEDTYLALTGDKVNLITMQKNLLNRKSKTTKYDFYDFEYDNDNVRIYTYDRNYTKVEIDDENLEALALEAKKNDSSTEYGHIYYLFENKYAIINLMNDDEYIKSLGEYLYHDKKYIQRINTSGDLRNITYFE